MRMKLISGLVVAIALGSSAHAVELVANGNFSSISSNNANPAPTGSFEYDPSQPAGDNGVVTSWQVVNPNGNSSYDILYTPSTATNTEPLNRFNPPSADNQELRTLPA